MFNFSNYVLKLNFLNRLSKEAFLHSQDSKFDAVICYRLLKYGNLAVLHLSSHQI